MTPPVLLSTIKDSHLNAGVYLVGKVAANKMCSLFRGP
jgi:hypothetical protein